MCVRVLVFGRHLHLRKRHHLLSRWATFSIDWILDLSSAWPSVLLSSALGLAGLDLGLGWLVARHLGRECSKNSFEVAAPPYPHQSINTTAPAVHYGRLLA